MILNYVKFEVRTNTAEVSWVEVDEVKETQVKCVNYSADQKAEFLAEVEGAEAYVVAMGWE